MQRGHVTPIVGRICRQLFRHNLLAVADDNTLVAAVNLLALEVVNLFAVSVVSVHQLDAGGIVVHRQRHVVNGDADRTGIRCHNVAQRDGLTAAETAGSFNLQRQQRTGNIVQKKRKITP